MIRLIQIVKAKDREFDIHCDCHGEKPEAALFYVENEKGVRAWLCHASYLERVVRDIDAELREAA